MIFHTDLDNTIIYSYKHNIGEHKRAVERYQGREISFITELTYEMLRDVKDEMTVVPTTTRTKEQYERIDLGVGRFPYELVCNGGVLLIEGKRDKSWYETSVELVRNVRELLDDSVKFLEKDKRTAFEVQFIEELFVFTKCDKVESVVKDLRERLDLTKLDVFHNGSKLYVIPKTLAKGKALERMKEYTGDEQIISAGDSYFDVSMFEHSDLSFAPESLAKKVSLPPETVVLPEYGLFSEMMLNEILVLLSF
ncbi:MAG: HAD hydrolase family protein [Filifactor alocis]|nr:HAD hydrolase family protein [Filifactor alocis]